MAKLPAPLLALVLAACGSSRPADTPAPRSTGGPASADVPVGHAVALPGQSRALSLELQVRAGAPEGLRRDTAAGRTWLDLRKPHGLSFVGPALLGGQGPFRPERASVTWARPRGGAASSKRHPALWRMEGTVAADALRARIESVDSTDGSGRTVAGLSDVRDADLRVLLGRGVDVLMAAAGPAQGGHQELDTHGWGGVADGAGASVPTDTWLADLVRAHGEASLDPLADRFVLVRRWRPSGSPRATWFRLRLADVAVAAQTVLKSGDGEAFPWVWEGLWRGELGPEPTRTEPAPWTDAPPLTIHYKEFDPPRRGGVTGGFFRVLLAPLALGADFGTSFFDETEDAGILETTLEKQRARRDR